MFRRFQNELFCSGYSVRTRTPAVGDSRRIWTWFAKLSASSCDEAATRMFALTCTSLDECVRTVMLPRRCSMRRDCPEGSGTVLSNVCFTSCCGPLGCGVRAGAAAALIKSSMAALNVYIPDRFTSFSLQHVLQRAFFFLIKAKQLPPQVGIRLILCEVCTAIRDRRI